MRGSACSPGRRIRPSRPPAARQARVSASPTSPGEVGLRGRGAAPRPVLLDGHPEPRRRRRAVEATRSCAASHCDGARVGGAPAVAVRAVVVDRRHDGRAQRTRDPRDDRAGRRPRAVPPAGRRRQLDRDAVGGRGAGGSAAGPGQDQGVLALEEPVAAHAAGGATLGGVLRIRRDLERAGLGAGQGAGRPAGRHDDRVLRRVDDPEPDRPLAGGELDPGHPAGRATLRAHL